MNKSSITDTFVFASIIGSLGLGIAVPYLGYGLNQDPLIFIVLGAVIFFSAFIGFLVTK